MVEEKTITLKELAFIFAFSRLKLARSYKIQLEIEERDLCRIITLSGRVGDNATLIHQYLEKIGEAGLEAPGTEKVADDLHHISHDMLQHAEYRLKLTRESLEEVNEEVLKLDIEMRKSIKQFGPPRKVEDILAEDNENE